MISSQEQDAPIVEEPKWRVPEWFAELDAKSLEMLSIFHIELLKFNKMMSLISKHTMINADLVHFSDAIAAGRLILQHSDDAQIYDIGSGNGIPGLVLAVMAPDREIICVDSNAKKTEVIRHFASRMGLKNVKTFNARFEDLGEETVSTAVSRGFASLAKSLLMARKSLIVGGQYYHMKSSNWSNELSEIPTQMFRHWNANDHFDYNLPLGGPTMSVVVTKKWKS